MSLIKNDVSANNTIVLSVNEDRAPYLQLKADGSTIKPGHLLKRKAASVNEVVLFDRGEGKCCQRLFAVENTRHGKTIDDTYDDNSTVFCRVCRSGDVIMAWVETDTATLPQGVYLGPGPTAGFLTRESEMATGPEVGGLIAISLNETTVAVSSTALIKVQIL